MQVRSSALVTAAITADGTTGGKIDAADYAGAAQYVDWYMPMTYDYFGAWDAPGPDGPALAADLLHRHPDCRASTPTTRSRSSRARASRRASCCSASASTAAAGPGVTQTAPGGTATGAAPGTYEAGIEDYKVLKTSCPATGTVAGTAYAVLRQQLVELRHPDHHRRQDDLRRRRRAWAARSSGSCPVTRPTVS